jgi:hypothetical protein
LIICTGWVSQRSSKASLTHDGSIYGRHGRTQRKHALHETDECPLLRALRDELALLVDAADERLVVVRGGIRAVVALARELALEHAQALLLHRAVDEGLAPARGPAPRQHVVRARAEGRVRRGRVRVVRRVGAQLGIV